MSDVCADMLEALPGPGAYMRAAKADNGGMRIARLLLVLLVASASFSVAPAAARPHGTTRLVGGAAAPSPSPSPGAGAGDRSRSPGFVVLLAFLALGLVWQVQRVRRATSEVSAQAMDELESTLRPGEEQSASGNGRFDPPRSGK
jgi:hypothetical protein